MASMGIAAIALGSAAIAGMGSVLSSGISAHATTSATETSSRANLEATKYAIERGEKAAKDLGLPAAAYHLGASSSRYHLGGANISRPVIAHPGLHQSNFNNSLPFLSIPRSRV
jgi:hypothetical protein